MDDILCLSPLEEVAHEIEELGSLALRHCKTVSVLCSLRTAFSCEEVHLVTLPSAWEVHAESAVIASVLEVVRHEHELVTGKDLRIAAHCGHHGHGDLHSVRILAESIAETCCIVVSREDHHIRKIVIHEVMREDVVYAEDTLAPARIILVETCAESIVEREVHDRLEVRVEAVLVLVAALPVCKLRNGSCPALAYDVEVRILVHHGLAPLRHRILLVVWICIHTESVEVSPLDPPDCPLLEILEHERVVKVHVDHGGVEPAAFLDIEVLL